jgi:hypothetical protein
MQKNKKKKVPDKMSGNFFLLSVALSPWTNWNIKQLLVFFNHKREFNYQGRMTVLRQLS